MRNTCSKQKGCLYFNGFNLLLNMLSDELISKEWFLKADGKKIKHMKSCFRQ